MPSDSRMRMVSIERTALTSSEKLVEPTVVKALLSIVCSGSVSPTVDTMSRDYRGDMVANGRLSISWFGATTPYSKIKPLQISA